MRKTSSQGTIPMRNWPMPPASAPAAGGDCRRTMDIGGSSFRNEPDGRGDWIRTSDPHTPSVMRYQAALRPDRSPKPADPLQSLLDRRTAHLVGRVGQG